MALKSPKSGNDSALASKLAEIQAEYDRHLSTVTGEERSSASFRESIVRIGELEEIIILKRRLESIEKRIREAEDIIRGGEDEMEALAREELQELEAEKKSAESEACSLLFPEDPDNLKNAIVEIRAGVGGDEAALFARDLFRMYSRFCEKKGYSVDLLTSHTGESPGFKEIIFIARGKGAYRELRHEGGVHRVQRIPDTENYGRIHTSASTVAVFPDVEDRDVKIDPADLRIDTFRSSGAGGQSVNKTSSAVRITHLPTGMVISCQDERSQIQNRAKGMKILKVRLQALYETEKKGKIDSERRALVRTGERSEKIRTYNFPQNRITDHRIDLTLYNLDSVMEGNMEELIDRLKEGLQ